MVRLIKRYGGGSRKLYDTEESRYVSLDEIAQWVRKGQQLQVVDSKTGDDVTAQTLAQVIYEGEKRGISFLPTELLHDVIRLGERAFSSGVEQIQSGVDRLMRASVDHLTPVKRAREEMDFLRERLDELDRSIKKLEKTAATNSPGSSRSGRKRARSQSTTRKRQKT
jgi:polyhydroxyalkanoate synthesis repressor PhaR